MTNVNIKYFLWGILGLSGIFLFSFAQLSGVDLPQPKNFFSLLPKVVAVDVIIVFLFVKWIWKWEILHSWLVPFPDLSGTWLGEIQSDYLDEESGKKIEPVYAMLTIQQSFLVISCVMKTVNMRSDSYTESFQIDSERQIKKLNYSYSSKSNSDQYRKNPAHYGSVSFEIIQGLKIKLKGHYWTERKTTGMMEFDFYSKSQLQEFPLILHKGT